MWAIQMGVACGGEREGSYLLHNLQVGGGGPRYRRSASRFAIIAEDRDQPSASFGQSEQGLSLYSQSPRVRQCERQRAPLALIRLRKLVQGVGASCGRAPRIGRGRWRRYSPAAPARSWRGRASNGYMKRTGRRRGGGAAAVVDNIGGGGRGRGRGDGECGDEEVSSRAMGAGVDFNACINRGQRRVLTAGSGSGELGVGSQR